jgi:RNase P subunit RPR2
VPAPNGILSTPQNEGELEESAMAKKTCAACDYPLEPKSTIEVKIGGKTVEVCCEECATKLREAATAKQKKRA